MRDRPDRATWSTPRLRWMSTAKPVLSLRKRSNLQNFDHSANVCCVRDIFICNRERQSYRFEQKKRTNAGAKSRGNFQDTRFSSQNIIFLFSDITRELRIFEFEDLGRVVSRETLRRNSSTLWKHVFLTRSARVRSQIYSPTQLITVKPVFNALDCLFA